MPDEKEVNLAAEIAILARDLDMQPLRLFDIIESVVRGNPTLTKKQHTDMVINRLRLEGVLR